MSIFIKDANLQSFVLDVLGVQWIDISGTLSACGAWCHKEETIWEKFDDGAFALSLLRFSAPKRIKTEGLLQKIFAWASAAPGNRSLNIAPALLGLKQRSNGFWGEGNNPILVPPFIGSPRKGPISQEEFLKLFEGIDVPEHIEVRRFPLIPFLTGLG